MQIAGQWVEFNDDKLASSDAITARHDAYIGDIKPAEPATSNQVRIGRTLMSVIPLIGMMMLMPGLLKTQVLVVPWTRWSCCRR